VTVLCVPYYLGSGVQMELVLALSLSIWSHGFGQAERFVWFKVGGCESHTQHVNLRQPDEALELV